MADDRREENRVRSLASRHGYRVSKSRGPVDNIDNHGDYMLTDSRNHCVLGGRYEATPQEIEDYIRQENPEPRGSSFRRKFARKFARMRVRAFVHTP